MLTVVAHFILKVQFFEDLGVRKDAIGNMLVKFPPLLTYSLHKKIRPVVCPSETMEVATIKLFFQCLTATMIVLFVSNN